MSARLSPLTFLYLSMPPLMWASNAIVGRMAVGSRDPLISPLLLNATRWAVTLAILAGIHTWMAAHPRDGATKPPLREVAKATWRTFALFGLLAIASYNALQYMALQTSSAINATLIAASAPLFMLVLGRLFFGAHARRAAWAGAGLSLVGVLVVMTRGEPARLAGLSLAGGDLLMVLATIVWALYTWLLRRRRPDVGVVSLLLLQTAWGVAISIPVVGVEWASGHFVLKPAWSTLAVVMWVALGPSLLAYFCWDRGIARAGPLLPVFFANLTPLLAALMSAALLGEPPQLFHAVAFALIAGGIVVSQRGAAS